MMSFVRPSPLRLRSLQAGVTVALLVLLGACSALPDRPQRPVTYDFGPGVITAPTAGADKPLPALALAEVEPSGLLEGSTGVLYRLAYADAQKLLPYAQARWSTPAAQLVRQRLRETLGQRRCGAPARDPAGQHTRGGPAAGPAPGGGAAPCRQRRRCRRCACAGASRRCRSAGNRGLVGEERVLIPVRLMRLVRHLCGA